MYVLRVYGESERAPNGESALVLSRVDAHGMTAVAQHDPGISLADIAGIPLQDILRRTPEGKNRSAWLREAGIALYERLAPEPIDRALRDVGEQPVALDLRSDVLRAVPWEVLRRPGFPRALFSLPRSPWLCGTGRAGTGSQQVTHEWPLRMLIVVGSAGDDTRVQARQETHTLERLARGRLSPPTADISEEPRTVIHTRSDILLNTLFQPNLDQLGHEIRRFKPHIFHFIGHGRVRDGEPELHVFSHTDGVNHPWGYDQICTAFDLDAVPRLVYLDACHSGFDDPDAWSLTQAFRDIGVGAVVSMQQAILGSTAVEVARAFYMRLLSGASVAYAMADARREIVAKDRNAAWYVPRLWVRGEPTDVVRVGGSPSTSARQQLFSCPRLSQRMCFVGRWPQRYDAWRGAPAAESAGLAIVRGARESGRTSFAQLIMESHTLMGHAVHYVDFRGIGGDYLAILERILAVRALDGHCSYIRAALDMGGFEKFIEAVPTGETREQKVLIGNMRGRIMTAFWDGLQASATDTPLFLVLDHLERERLHEEVIAKHIAYELFHKHRPPDTATSVHVLMVLDDEQNVAVARQPFKNKPPVIDIAEFSAEERDYYMPLYFEWRELADPDAEERMRKFIEDFHIPCPAGFERAEKLLALVRRNNP